MGRPTTASFCNTSATAREWAARFTGTGAGTANVTKVKGRGLTITRQGVGLYTMSFTDASTLVGLDGVTHTAATVAPQEWKFVPASFVKQTPTTPATVGIECWSAAGSLADPPAASLVDLYFTFYDNPADA